MAKARQSDEESRVGEKIRVVRRAKSQRGRIGAPRRRMDARLRRAGADGHAAKGRRESRRSEPHVRRVRRPAVKAAPAVDRDRAPRDRQNALSAPAVSADENAAWTAKTRSAPLREAHIK